MSTGYLIYCGPDELAASVVWEQEEADELVRRLNALALDETACWAWREIWVEPEPVRKGGYLTASDRENLLLARAHEALGTVRPIGVSFSFPFDREGAFALAAELLRCGWTYAGVDEQLAEDDLWHACGHGRRMAVTRESIAELRRDMEELAARHGGRYDGWNVSGGLGLRSELGQLAD